MLRSDKAQQIQKPSGHRDAVTGLYSYGYFNKKAALFDTEQALPLSVIICDINGLHFVGEMLGDDKRDGLLSKAAGFISSCVRKGDIVARGEGGKFFILLPQTSAAVAGIIQERIQNACRNNKDEADGSFLCPDLAIGCATKQRQREDLRDILTAAEKNMSAQKLIGQKDYYASLLQPIRKALNEKSHETEQHGKRLVRQSKLLGEALGLSDEQLKNLEMLAMLHDIGKVGIDESILNKPGPLNEREWREVKKHPETGYRIAKAVPQLSRIAKDILSHHERWDGNGYPGGLKRESIPLLSRIIAVVDAFDALTSDRCYRGQVSKSEALLEIERCAGTQFDPEVAKAFVTLKRRRRSR